jgi:hypothetical protein
MDSPHKVDVAGSLFTSLHRHIKIEGRQMPRQDMEGTGSVSLSAATRRSCPAACVGAPLAADKLFQPTPFQCFDITELSPTRPGAHKPLQVAHEELPRWSKAMQQYMCACHKLAAWEGGLQHVNTTPEPTSLMGEWTQHERWHGIEPMQLLDLHGVSLIPSNSIVHCAPSLQVITHLSIAPPPARRYPSPKPDPHAYLRKGEGALVRAFKAPDAAAVSRDPPAAPPGTIGAPPSPPRAGAATLRDNPPNTAFRRFYERGDLPISVDHKSFKNAIKWKVCVAQPHGSLQGSLQALSL